MNGWFPKINFNGQIASGNDGIWVDSKQVSPVGTSPFWIGSALCYNRNDGTTQVGADIVPFAYNEYCGSERAEWTGFTASGIGSVDFWNDITKTNSADGACLAKYAGYGSVYGFNLAYVAPYNTNEHKTLVYNNIPIYHGKVTNYAISLNGIIAWQIATGTYERQIINQSRIISIRKDESPISVFEFLGQSWILTQTQIGLLCYPFGSVFGYFLPGDLFYPDSRVIDNKLMIVGSSSSGELVTKIVDFGASRSDLRLI